MTPSLPRQTLAFAAIRTVLNTLHRMVYPFLPVFSRGLGVEIGALTLAITARSIVGMAAPFVATIADARGRKLAMLIGLSLFTAGAALVVFWPTYPVFAAALILTTAGKYIFDPPMQAYLGDRAPYHTRGRVLAITELGWSLAFIGGIPLMGFLIARWGWMSPFWALTLLGLAAIFLLNRMIPRENPRGATGPTVFANLRSVTRSAPALAGLAVGAFCSAANEIISLIFGVWLEDSFGLQIAALGIAAAVIGLSELSAEFSVGAWVDRLGKPRAIALGLLLNSLTSLLLPVLGQTLPGALAGLFLFYLSFEFALVSAIPLMTEILPGARATLMAFNVAGLSLGRAVGALAAAPLYGWGIWGSVALAVGFNLLALAALRRVGYSNPVNPLDFNC